MLTAKLKSHGFMGLGKKTKKITLRTEGIIEACYHTETANELWVISQKEYSHENIEFIVACHHLLLSQAGMRSRFQNMAGLQGNNLKDQLKQTLDRYIWNTASRQVNLPNATRTKLENRRTAILASISVRSLFEARTDIVQMFKKDTLPRHFSRGGSVSKRLAERLNKTPSPSDKKVRSRLAKMGPDILHLGGKKLSLKETQDAYLALNKSQ